MKKFGEILKNIIFRVWFVNLIVIAVINIWDLFIVDSQGDWKNIMIAAPIYFLLALLNENRMLTGASPSRVSRTIAPNNWAIALYAITVVAFCLADFWYRNVPCLAVTVFLILQLIALQFSQTIAIKAASPSGEVTGADE